ncbi:19446_t:CDS:2 [Racocetra fulgida]|uniref:19446_t:CDS:1 n=1 Tax=Racocetra fulgida TaxID=60492 RepID=A0A9N9FFR0_9GLOM|nr:19446_t:CDS:2 [Racocetra fulgida]
MDAVGKDFALQDESMKITNTLYYCTNHLKDCSYFAIKHSPEQIQNIINLAISTSKKCVATSYIDEEEEKNDSTSTYSSKEVISRVYNLFEEVKKLGIRTNCLITDSARSYTAAYHCLRHNDLKLFADIEVVINHDSF